MLKHMLGACVVVAVVGMAGSAGAISLVKDDGKCDKLAHKCKPPAVTVVAHKKCDEGTEHKCKP